MTSLHALSLRLPFSYGWRLPAHLYTKYWYSCVAVYVTTATHRRTTTQQQVSAAAGAFAPGFLPPGGHAISACACHDHAHATASAVDLLPATCACGVWLYNTWVVFRPRVNMNAREILRYCLVCLGSELAGAWPGREFLELLSEIRHCAPLVFSGNFCGNLPGFRTFATEIRK